MNKVLNINLGGMPFTIDEDAYDYLKKYLDTIHRHFRQSEGYAEITSDIEARMAELFKEKAGGSTIIGLGEVQSVISIMGRPEDFGAEPMDTAAAEGPASGAQGNAKATKRLFRNPDEKVLGGVCSGIAAYFGIEDPIWVRLAFVLFAFIGGGAILFYIILWMIVPQAQTAADRLIMRGVPVNASNIGRVVEEEMQQVSKKVIDFGKELKEEFGSKKKSSAAAGQTGKSGGEKLREVFNEVLSFVGSILTALIKFLASIVKPLAFLIGLALVISVALAWTSIVAAVFLGYSFVEFLMPAPEWLAALGVANLLVFIGILFLMLILGIGRLLMRQRGPGTHWMIGLWLVWFANVASLMYVASHVLRDFSGHGEVTGTTTAVSPGLDTIYIDMDPVEQLEEEGILVLGDKLRIESGALYSSDIRLKFEKVDSTGGFEIIQKNTARGKNAEEGKLLAGHIAYECRIDSNRVTLPGYFQLGAEEKWRGQQVTVTVKVPEGKWVKVNKAARDKAEFSLSDERDKYPSRRSQWRYYWKMGPEGFTLPDYREGGSSRF
jgi:phage shock protein C